MDHATDVLSFPPTMPRSMPDWATWPSALDTASVVPRRQGAASGPRSIPLPRHGLLHLLGHDHERPAAARAMARLERPSCWGGPGWSPTRFRPQRRGGDEAPRHPVRRSPALAGSWRPCRSPWWCPGSRCASSTRPAGSSLLAWVALVPAALGAGAGPHLAGRRGARLRRRAGLLLRRHPLGEPRHDRLRRPAAGVAFIGLSVLVGFMAAHWALAAAAAFAVRRALGWPLWLPPPGRSGPPPSCCATTSSPASPGPTSATPRSAPCRWPSWRRWAGVYAIAFLVVLVNAALAEALEARLAGRPPPLRGCWPASARAAGAGGGRRRPGGWRRCAPSWPARPPSRWRLVQVNLDQGGKNRRAGPRRGYVLERLVPPTLEADRRGGRAGGLARGGLPGLRAPRHPQLRRRARPAAAARARPTCCSGAATLEELRGPRRRAAAAGSRTPPSWWRRTSR